MDWEYDAGMGSRVRSGVPATLRPTDILQDGREVALRWQTTERMGKRRATNNSHIHVDAMRTTARDWVLQRELIISRRIHI